MTLYKVLDYDGSARMGRGSWPLPVKRYSMWAESRVDAFPGEWMEVEGELVPCINGLHLAEGEEQLLQWLGPRIFEATFKGERVDSEAKVVVRRARLLRETAWNDRSARLFACDCAERVLSIWEEEFPDDENPRRCIEVARAFAEGRASEWVLNETCRGGWIAANNSHSAGFRRQAAVAAAEAASRDPDMAANAARHSAWAMAGSRLAPVWSNSNSERRWQAQRLREYLWPDDYKEGPGG